METETLQKGLSASAFVFERCKRGIDTTDGLEQADLRKIKRAALVSNKALAHAARANRERVDQLEVHLHLLRAEAERDRIDHDANRARIMQLFSRFRIDEASRHLGAQGSEKTTTTNVLSTHSTNERAIERALTTAAKLEAAMHLLSPVGRTSVHGAGALMRALERELSKGVSEQTSGPSEATLVSESLSRRA